MISLIITLALIGLIVYLVTKFIPMPEIFRTVILVVVVIFVILWLMRVLGIADVPVPRVR